MPDPDKRRRDARPGAGQMQARQSKGVTILGTPELSNPAVRPLPFARARARLPVSGIFPPFLGPWGDRADPTLRL